MVIVGPLCVLLPPVVGAGADPRMGTDGATLVGRVEPCVLAALGLGCVGDAAGSVPDGAAVDGRGVADCCCEEGVSWAEPEAPPRSRRFFAFFRCRLIAW